MKEIFGQVIDEFEEAMNDFKKDTNKNFEDTFKALVHIQTKIKHIIDPKTPHKTVPKIEIVPETKTLPPTGRTYSSVVSSTLSKPLDTAGSRGPTEPASSRVTPPSSARPTVSRRGKSAYSRKPKVLYVGDTIAHNVDFVKVEKQTNTRIRTMKAYSSQSAQYPGKNMAEIASTKLLDTKEDDKFTHLVLAAPSDDITNLDTRKVTANDDADTFQDSAIVSAQNMFNIAETALKNNKHLRKVVVMEHAPRYDLPEVDPSGLKPKLADFANLALGQMWRDSPLRDHIILGKHNISRNEEQKNTLFTDDWTGSHDGVHMNRIQGKKVYTESVLNILRNSLHSSSSASPDSDHKNCPQANYQRRKISEKQFYTIPVNNKFHILGN